MLDMVQWGNGFELKINKHNSLLAVWNSFSADFGETGSLLYVVSLAYPNVSFLCSGTTLSSQKLLARLIL